VAEAMRAEHGPSTAADEIERVMTETKARRT
jgi:hypothetical protein